MNRIIRKNSLLISALAVLAFTVSSCHKSHDRKFSETVYEESNDYHDMRNAIFAYQQNDDGKLEQYPEALFIRMVPVLVTQLRN